MRKFIFNCFLEEDEFIIKVFRQPLFFFFHSIFLRAIFWGGLAFSIWFFYPRYEFAENLNFDINYIWQAVALVGILHSIGPFCFWYINSIIMTNESLIIVDWPKLFIRRSTRIDFHNLDEVTVEKLGIRAFLMNYGNIVLSKVNGGEAYTIPSISGPTRCARTIESYREKILDEKNFTEESALKGLLGGMVQRHVGDHGQPEPEKRHAFTRRYENSKHYQEEEHYENSQDLREVVREIRYEKSPQPYFDHRQERRAQPMPKRNIYQKFFGKKQEIQDKDILVEKELDDGGGIDIDLGR